MIGQGMFTVEWSQHSDDERNDRQMSQKHNTFHNFIVWGIINRQLDLSIYSQYTKFGYDWLRDVESRVVTDR